MPDEALWDAAVKQYAGALNGLGRTANEGMPGTATADSVRKVLDYVHKEVFLGQPWGLYDPGAADGRMLVLGLARGASFAAGNELIGAPLVSRRVSREHAMVGVFSSHVSTLGVHKRTRLQFGTPVEAVSLITVHPCVDHNIFVYSFDDGWNRAARMWLYKVVSQQAGIKCLLTMPSVGATGFAQPSDVLEVLGASFRMLGSWPVTLAGADTHRHRTCWLFGRI